MIYKNRRKTIFCDQSPFYYQFEIKSYAAGQLYERVQRDSIELSIWHLKHKELIWWFIRCFQTEELRSFFHPMTDEQVPFKSLVLTHYRKANNTEEFAGLCRYGYIVSLITNLHSFCGDYR